MRLLYLTFTLALCLICPVFSASILDHSDWKVAQGWEGEISLPSYVQETPYRCSTLPPDDSKFVFDEENLDVLSPEMARKTFSVAQARSFPHADHIPDTYSSSTPCKSGYGTQSILHRRVGFMPLIDVLSILGVGLFALAASGVAAILRRRDVIALYKGVSTPRLESYHSDYLHGLPSSGDPIQSEYMLKYLKSKLR